MSRIAARALEPSLRASADPLAADLLSRLLSEPTTPPRAKVTRPFPRRTALHIYRRKAIKGDRPGVHTDGYPELLAALGAIGEGDVMVHGVRFADAVFLAFTDPERRQCLGVLRKRLSGSGPPSGGT